MSSAVADLPAFVERIMASLGYPGLALLMLVENLIPPIPSEVVLPLAGFLVSRGDMAAVPAIVAATFGSVVGALLLYLLGRAPSEARLHRFLERYGARSGLTPAAAERAAAALRRHGPAVLFWSRLVPGLRSVVSIPAGAARIPLPVFLAWTTLGTLCWNVALLGAGVALGRNWSRVLEFGNKYEAILLWSAGALVVVFVVRRIAGTVRRRRFGREIP